MNKPTDEYWRSIVEYSLVPTSEHLYIVGSFARSVTVYSQQVRAIGLVDALAGLGKLRHSSRVAIVGGGISGMTAAAGLWQLGIRPIIFEKESTLAELQRNSGKRYLHPHIYDWPLKSLDDKAANLPVLDWTANVASEVVKNLEAQWNQISGGAAEIRGEVNRLERVGRCWRVSTTESSDEFDVVLCCVGFGVEGGTFSYPYWADLPLDDPQVHAENWLVSGAGDGALTDLMRLCIRNFLHADALRAVVQAVENTSGNDAMEKLRQRVKQRVTGRELFEGLDAQAIAGALELRGNAVTLIANEAELFGTNVNPARSSVLNRLVLWILLCARKVTIRDGRLPSDGISGQRGNFIVRIDGINRTIKCQDLLLRHGPNAPFGKYDKPRLPDWMENRWGRAVRRLAQRWKLLYEGAGRDPTVLRRHWSDHMLETDRLSPDFRKSVGLLVYSREAVGKDSNSFSNTIRAALVNDRIRSALGRTPGEGVKISSLHLEDALANPRAFSRTIRALCDAPIVIFDGTVELPSLIRTNFSALIARTLISCSELRCTECIGKMPTQRRLKP